MAEKTTKVYVCAAGIDHTKGRNERGERYTGPEKALDWLVPQGAVVEEGSDAHAAIAAETTETEA
jgi:hypothetical protein